MLPKQPGTCSIRPQVPGASIPVPNGDDVGRFQDSPRSLRAPVEPGEAATRFLRRSIATTARLGAVPPLAEAPHAEICGMVKQVLFVQGAGEAAHDAWDAKLVRSLERALGEGYRVLYPRMPDEAD